eukprot:2694437-Pleurochrysis_carterae.AAC.3
MPVDEPVGSSLPTLRQTLAVGAWPCVHAANMEARSCTRWSPLQEVLCSVLQSVREFLSAPQDLAAREAAATTAVQTLAGLASTRRRCPAIVGSSDDYCTVLAAVNPAFSARADPALNRDYLQLIYHATTVMQSRCCLSLAFVFSRLHMSDKSKGNVFNAFRRFEMLLMFLGKSQQDVIVGIFDQLRDQREV